MNLEVGQIGAAGTRDLNRSRGKTSHKALRTQMLAGMVVIDVVAVFVGFLIGEWIYASLSGEGQMRGIFSPTLAILPIYVAAAVNARAYSSGIFSNRGSGVARAVQALVLAIGATTFIAFYMKIGESFSRGAFAIGSVVALVSLIVGRNLLLRIIRRRHGNAMFSTILISDGQQLAATGDYSMYVCADTWFTPETDCPLMYDRLARALSEADRVVVDCTPDRRHAWVNALKGANVRSEIVAPELQGLGPIGVGGWGGKPTLVVAQAPLSGPEMAIKRLFDVCFAGVALIALLPLFAIVSLMIRLESAGPIFFVQTRIGLGNKMFAMYKFRSMRTEMCDANASTLTARNDSRVTRVGKFIRKTSIDELPQLLNVLKGDMSVVGPRPHALGARAADKLYWEIDGRYWHRHAVKPGLTGLVQVSGFRGNTENAADLENRLQADFAYMKNWSLWNDLLIIFRTFKVVVHSNAF
ncbi:exopolysaccharide biosynthesis polyprenyl glycosylphosphotransferase [Sphingomonas sp. CJ99]